VADQIRADGGVGSVRRLDVTDLAAVERVLAQVIAEHGRIDVLCNNAGAGAMLGQVLDVPAAVFAAVQALNLTGLYACCRATLPHMIRQRYGRIVNMSSGSAFSLDPGESAYAASKAAVNALTITLAKEVRENNILVNAMSPGSARTDLNPTGTTHPRECVPTARRRDTSSDSCGSCPWSPSSTWIGQRGDSLFVRGHRFVSLSPGEGTTCHLAGCAG